MASRTRRTLPCLGATDPERPPPDLTRDLLEEIFLRVSSPVDLARASTACVSFRRLISDPSFLRRYRSIHPPLLLGFLHTGASHPVEATHPAAAVARAVARTADFSFGFLPSRRWYPCDVRDGRVLVGRLRMDRHFSFSWDLAVCDPLFQRYLLLPPITDDLLASVGLRNQDVRNSRSALIPSRGMEEETSSSVICWMISKTSLVVFIFSTSSGQWAAGASIGWADLGLYEDVTGLDSGHCVYGCFYWKVSCRNKLLKLDMSTMVLSKYDLPPDYVKRNVIIVESGEGKVAMFSALRVGTSLEYYTLLPNGTEKSHKWHLKSTIPLPFDGTSGFFIADHTEGYVFLVRFIKEQDTTNSEFFSHDVRSLNIEKVCRSSVAFQPPPYFAYFGFPPSMSPRRIQEYGED